MEQDLVTVRLEDVSLEIELKLDQQKQFQVIKDQLDLVERVRGVFGEHALLDELKQAIAGGGIVRVESVKLMPVKQAAGDTYILRGSRMRGTQINMLDPESLFLLVDEGELTLEDRAAVEQYMARHGIERLPSWLVNNGMSYPDF